MRYAALSGVIVAIVGASAASAACTVPRDTTFSDAFAMAYKAGTLPELQNVYCSVKQISVVIRHSISEEPERSGSFKSFRGAQAWINAQRVDGFPTPATWVLKECAKGTCRYSGNQLHTHLFLMEVEIVPLPMGMFGVKVLLEDGD